MARIGKLSAIAVNRASGPAVLHDGGGLYLRVSATGAKSWVFRYQLDGKRRDMGLGAFPAVSLAGARERAEAHRKQRAEGIDLYIVFLVRDAQDVLASWRRDDVPEPQFSTLKTNAYLWLTHLLTLVVFPRRPRARRLLGPGQLQGGGQARRARRPAAPPAERPRALA